ncbi:radical SAM peptide maturase, CXXX-repeat target family [Sporosalibacterium faouarense]|uniref:radical SAM peptide maturase, CXXX-repeat target family n=1 Tax=Sporosalibacterium faouarense TaxID=516123 RepID=UPI00192AA5B3|nr:radical SAM peptide maturase, CXXX-repeat target family [Sporosalibacterium faouarense]
MGVNSTNMGNLSPQWNGNGKKTRSVTFCVTEDCNLACKYCYMEHKNKRKRMTFEVAKKAVDYILNDREEFRDNAIVWDFIGGEPFLEIDLIDKVSDYIKQQMLILDHPSFNNYRFSFSTNGLLYNTPKVQKYIRKNKGHISVNISVDGNRVKHDLQRVYPNGKGSYDDVVKNVPLWMEQFGDVQTKATFAHDDLPHLKDSIISLWNLGIKWVSANVVFEDIWEEGDDEIFENQLMELADYVIDNELWNDYSVRFFNPRIGFPLDKELKKDNFCGAGHMLAVDCEGRYYPCIRFLDFTLMNKVGLCIGDVDHGINEDLQRRFWGLNLENQSSQECINCEVGTGCAWCSGFNYDVAETDTVYQRATYLCKMHKANVRACEYFWQKYEEATGKKSPRREIREEKLGVHYLQFITGNSITPHCNYRNNFKTKESMSKKLIEKGLKFARDNHYTPVFLGNQDGNLEENYPNNIFILDSKDKTSSKNNITIYNNEVADTSNSSDIATILISKKNIVKIYKFIEELNRKKRINIVLQDVEKWELEDINEYEDQLRQVSQLVIESYENGTYLSINILTDRLNLNEHYGCEAGVNSIALAPNGKLYICPAFYFDEPENNIGDLETGIKVKNDHLFKLSNAPICSECDAYHCMRCKFLNEKLTKEINTPSKIQCVISHIERNITRELQQRLIERRLLSSVDKIPKIDYLDPLEKIIRNKKEA